MWKKLKTMWQRSTSSEELAVQKEPEASNEPVEDGAGWIDAPLVPQGLPGMRFKYQNSEYTFMGKFFSIHGDFLLCYYSESKGAVKPLFIKASDVTEWIPLEQPSMTEMISNVKVFPQESNNTQGATV